MLGALIAAGLLGGALAVAAALGRRAPRQHRAERTVEIAADPDYVLSVIADCAGYPEWLPGVGAAKRAPSADGRDRWHLTTTEGPLTLETTEPANDRRFISHIVDDGLPFGGTWVYEVRPRPRGCTVTVVEEGWIEKPLYRFFARYVFGYDRTITEALEALKKTVER